MTRPVRLTRNRVSPQYYAETFTEREDGLVPAPDTTTSTKFLRDDGTWATPSGGSLSDGDKGDITVSSSGTVWTIDNNVVTYAKIENMNAGTIIGRRSGAIFGDPEEIALDDTLVMRADSTIERAALSGEVTASSGSNTLALDKTAITNRSPVTAASGDYVLISDISDSNNLKKATAQSIADLAVGSGISEDLAIVYAIALG
jgi:hypothetical protein